MQTNDGGRHLHGSTAQFSQSDRRITLVVLRNNYTPYIISTCYTNQTHGHVISTHACCQSRPRLIRERQVTMATAWNVYAAEVRA